MNNPLKTIPLSKIIDKHIVKRGTERLEDFEMLLKTQLSNHKLTPYPKKRNSKKIVNLDN